MASVVEKLYPPVIGSAIPACYKISENQEQGTVVKITVPFSMNRAVDSHLIQGMKLKIKTVQSNTYLGTLDVDSLAEALNTRIATFTWTHFENANVKIGQYLKVQLAYVGKDSANAVGYFSTVGIVKYTSKPNVYIEGMSNDANQIKTFQQTYVGVYETTEDKGERPYAYIFYLYDSSGAIIETSGWLLHNTTINNIASESLSLNKATDTYTFSTIVQVNTEYYVQYGVRTINNLEIFSPTYTCLEPYIGPSDLHATLIATTFEGEENKGFDEGYIYLKFDLDENINSDTLMEHPISVEIARAEDTDGFTSWRTIQRLTFKDYESVAKWDYKDMTIEQGIYYAYCYRQYDENGLQSERAMSEVVYADFEDMFLLDNKGKQLKIRFNPKMSSFKIDRLETKMDTIGSKYPFFFRNGVVEYREFPIAGLISYLADNNEMFVDYEKDLNILQGAIPERINNNSRIELDENGRNIYWDNFYDINDLFPDEQYVDEKDPISVAKFAGLQRKKSWEVSETLNSVGHNIHAERIFKMKLLEWLGNGEIKLFRSPTEGNFLVRIMNVSLTPEEKLGRMLHNFSCTAYEVETLTYQNLVDLGFLTPQDKENQSLEMETVKLKDKIATITNINQSVRINNNTIENYLYLQPSPNIIGGPGFYVRIGDDSDSKKTYIQPGFVIKANNSTFPNIWFNIADNSTILQAAGLSNTVEGAIDLVGDAVLTYQYYKTYTSIGEFTSATDVYIRNVVETSDGPVSGLSFNSDKLDPNDNTQRIKTEVLKFFVLNFEYKYETQQIYEENDAYYSMDHELLVPANDIIYYIINDDGITYYKTSNNTLVEVSDNDKTITLIDEDNVSHTYTELPILNLNDNLYTSINYMGDLYKVQCAYQVKITTYKAG